MVHGPWSTRPTVPQPPHTKNAGWPYDPTSRCNSDGSDRGKADGWPEACTTELRHHKTGFQGRSKRQSQRHEGAVGEEDGRCGSSWYPAVGHCSRTVTAIARCNCSATCCRSSSRCCSARRLPCICRHNDQCSDSIHCWCSANVCRNCLTTCCRPSSRSGLPRYLCSSRLPSSYSCKCSEGICRRCPAATRGNCADKCCRSFQCCCTPKCCCPCKQQKSGSREHGGRTGL